jgi:hypothetical protein
MEIVFLIGSGLCVEKNYRTSAPDGLFFPMNRLQFGLSNVNRGME